jgi:glutamine synthetase
LGILLQKLDQNEFAHRVFGEKFCRMYGEGKKEEWERFCAYVTDWETAEYLYRC